LVMGDNWIGTFNRQLTFSPVSVDNSLLQTNMVLTSFSEHNSSEVWISYLDQVTRLVSRNTTNGRTTISNAVLLTPDYAKIFTDSNATTWSISCNGINRFNTSSRRFENWIKNNYTPPTPNLHLHFSYCRDGDGNIWQASERADFVKYDLQEKQVTDY